MIGTATLVRSKTESDSKLSIELVWEDVDLEELCITASTGEYCGSARVYFAQGDVAALTENLRGFPKASPQVEVFESCCVERSGPKLVFRCIDQLGHAAVRVSLAEIEDEITQVPLLNEVNLEMHFEASALDHFCKELEAIGKRTRKLAILPASVA